MRIESYKPYMQGLPQDKKLKAADWEEHIARRVADTTPSPRNSRRSTCPKASTPATKCSTR